MNDQVTILDQGPKVSVLDAQTTAHQFDLNVKVGSKLVNRAGRMVTVTGIGKTRFLYERITGSAYREREKVSQKISPVEQWRLVVE